MGKLPGDTRLIQARAYTRYFPSSDAAVVRVFWVCRTQARSDSLLEVLSAEPVAPFFRFTTSQEFFINDRHGDDVTHLASHRRQTP